MIVFTRPRTLDESGFSSAVKDEAILMTVGIGLICERGQAGVIAADRLVESDGGARFSGGKPKIEQINSRVFFTSAGTMPEDHVVKQMKELAANCDSVIQTIKAIHLLPWKHRVEQEIIRKEQLANTYDEFWKKANANPSEIKGEDRERVSGYGFGLTMIVMGEDKEGVHLYEIGKNGNYQDDTLAGFKTIGTGWQLALMGVLYNKKFDFTLDLGEAIYRVYEGKKAAECSGTVDEVTDIGIMRQGRGAQFVTPEAVNVLENIYQSHRQLSQQDRKTITEVIQRSDS
jgi:20S proteasome alpha/beta subunit